MSQPERELAVWHPTAIVWDLDGTLVESAPDLATALNALLNEHDQLGHPIARVDQAACEALTPRFMEIYTACATQHTHLVPHAREVLLHFYHAGLRQALCTNKPLSVTRQIVDALDISGFFASVVGGDSTPEKKPHPLPLQTCLDELGVKPAEALMIGDSGADVGAAKALGMTIVLVPDGYTGVPAESLGADHVSGNLADIPGWLGAGGNLKRSA
jgi:phosphoglycolate phosphatase